MHLYLRSPLGSWRGEAASLRTSCWNVAEGASITTDSITTFLKSGRYPANFIELSRLESDSAADVNSCHYVWAALRLGPSSMTRPLLGWSVRMSVTRCKAQLCEINPIFNSPHACHDALTSFSLHSQSAPERSSYAFETTPVCLMLMHPPLSQTSTKVVEKYASYRLSRYKATFYSHGL
jgi:hypothetical protein